MELKQVLFFSKELLEEEEIPEEVLEKEEIPEVVIELGPQPQIKHEGLFL